jgi:hypothetical protein
MANTKIIIYIGGTPGKINDPEWNAGTTADLEMKFSDGTTVSLKNTKKELGIEVDGGLFNRGTSHTFSTNLKSENIAKGDFSLKLIPKKILLYNPFGIDDAIGIKGITINFNGKKIRDLRYTSLLWISQNNPFNYVSKDPIDCIPGTTWSEWGPCIGFENINTPSNKKCGINIYAKQTKIRLGDIPAKNGGYSCGISEQSKECKLPPCDCVVSDWSPWSDCSGSCGGGIQKQTRTIIQRPENGGKACPELTQSKDCNTHACPVDCVVSEWIDWSGGCSKSCGGGIQTQTRTVVQEPKNGGKACPELTQTKDCNTHACPVDCVVSEWSPWSGCKSCGGGIETQTRTVIQRPENGGKACPELTQTRNCNTQPCPVDCKKGEIFSPWGYCSTDCGGGIRSRTRYEDIQPQYGGKACPPLIEEERCNTQPCPVDCQIGNGGNWSKCNTNCTQTRLRTGDIQPQYGGKSCPQTNESRSCSDGDCQNQACPNFSSVENRTVIPLKFTIKIPKEETETSKLVRSYYNKSDYPELAQRLYPVDLVNGQLVVLPIQFLKDDTNYWIDWGDGTSCTKNNLAHVYTELDKYVTIKLYTLQDSGLSITFGSSDINISIARVLLTFKDEDGVDRTYIQEISKGNQTKVIISLLSSGGGSNTYFDRNMGVKITS